MLWKKDFEFWKKDMSTGHEDYWFKAKGESSDYLAFKSSYAEMGVKGVFNVIYSKDEDTVYIQRTYMFNQDYVVSNDAELKQILISLLNECGEAD